MDERGVLVDFTVRNTFLPLGVCVCVCVRGREKRVQTWEGLPLQYDGGAPGQRRSEGRNLLWSQSGPCLVTGRCFLLISVGSLHPLR